MSRNNVSLSVILVLFALTSSAFAADVGFGQETPDQWRVSKLAGVPIYGPEHQKDGKITDVLMSKAGQAEYVIIGVGGFLGIDQKDVAIPFAHVKFADQPMLPPANPAGFDTIGSSNNGGMTHGSSTTAVGGTAMAPNGAVTVPDTGAGAMTQNTASPDHGVIDMTVDQLKSAPTLRFAR